MTLESNDTLYNIVDLIIAQTYTVLSRSASIIGNEIVMITFYPEK